MSKKLRLLIPIILVLAAALVVLLCFILRPQREDLPAESAVSATVGSVLETETPTLADIPGDVGIQEAEVHASEHLSLSSLYTSSIMNPDCNDEYAEDVISMEVTNTSGQYLLQAELAAQMSDGSTVTFLLRDLPAGAVAEVFDTSNGPLPEGVTCIRVDCLSETYTDDVPVPSGIDIQVENAVTYVVNNSNGPMENLTVVYRCDLGGVYFGGIAYELVIPALAPGERYEISHPGLFGAVSVVRVYEI